MQSPDFFLSVDSRPLRLVVQPSFKRLSIVFTSSAYHETAVGAGVATVSYLVTEDNPLGQTLFAFAKAIFIFPIHSPLSCGGKRPQHTFQLLMTQTFWVLQGYFKTVSMKCDNCWVIPVVIVQRLDYKIHLRLPPSANVY